MKKVEVKNGCGYKVYNDNGALIGFQGQNYGEGFIYKDYDAYEKTDDEVCYISEHAFDDYKDFIPLADAKKEGETKMSIREQVRDAFTDYLLTDKQVEVIADDVFELAEWAYVSTYIAENEDIEEMILTDDEEFFTEQQRRAVRRGLLPCEDMPK